jgi:hypothetical protein
MKKYQPLPQNIPPKSIEKPWVTEEQCSRAKEIESTGNDPELQKLMGEGDKGGSTVRVLQLSRAEHANLTPHDATFCHPDPMPPGYMSHQTPRHYFPFKHPFLTYNF